MTENTPKPNALQAIKLFFGIIIVGVVVALTYHIFENAIHGAINLIWYDWLDTSTKRILVIPTGILLTILFFGVQHYLDRDSETHEEHGLGNMPEATITNFLKVLFIGFLSLLAGATLGPEAVLVPACMIAGAYIGKLLFKSNDALVKALAAAAIMALFTAFFNSFIVGVLSLFLVAKQANTKISPMMVVIAAVASAASLVTLAAVEGSPLFEIPHYNWSISFTTILFSLLIAVVAFGATFVMSFIHDGFSKIRAFTNKQLWIVRALIAGSVLMLLYLLGGPLVEFTGNKSIVPLFDQAMSIGFWGLVWIFVVKVVAIAWSKAMGYRGGMIFPTIFLVAVLIALVQLNHPDFNMIYGFIAGVVGALAANKRTHILV